MTPGSFAMEVIYAWKDMITRHVRLLLPGDFFGKFLFPTPPYAVWRLPLLPF